MDMATRADIRADLTLELGDGHIAPGRFLRAVKAFFDLVEELSKEAAGTIAPPTWAVRVREGSNLIEAVPPVGYPAAIVQRVYERIPAGFAALESGEIMPEGFSERALHSASVLSRIREDLGEDAVSLRLWVKKEPIALTGHTAATVHDMLESGSVDHGSVDGRLEVISERGGTHVVIRETLWGRSIRCTVDEARLKDALALFGRRVEAYGEVRYRKDGEAIAIKVDEFVPFPDPRDIPSLEAVRGILKG
jgi:hypothetical protein